MFVGNDPNWSRLSGEKEIASTFIPNSAKEIYLSDCLFIPTFLCCPHLHHIPFWPPFLLILCIFLATSPTQIFCLCFLSFIPLVWTPFQYCKLLNLLIQPRQGPYLHPYAFLPFLIPMTCLTAVHSYVWPWQSFHFSALISHVIHGCELALYIQISLLLNDCAYWEYRVFLC